MAAKQKSSGAVRAGNDRKAFLRHRRLIHCTMIAACFVAMLAALPVAASPTAKSLKNAKGFKWTTKSTTNFDFFFEAGSPAERDIDKIAEQMEKSRAVVEKLLGGEFGRKTESFIVDSRARMKQLVGTEGNAFTFGNFNPLSMKIEYVTTMVYNDKIHGIGAHETCHVFSHNLWGKPHGLWIDEGLAVYSDDQWQGLPLHSVAKVLLDKGKLLPVTDLLDNNWIKKYSDMVTYPELGSFVKFLYEKYGMEAVKNLWQHGAKNAQGSFGKNLDALESEWRAELAKVDASSIRYNY